MAEFFTKELEKENRKNFDCGNDSLNRYFRQQITQDVRTEYAYAYVAIEQSTGELAGYYTFSNSAIPLVEVHPEWAVKVPRYPNVPATLIGRLAVARQFQGRGVGSFLMSDAVKRIKRMPTGARMLLVEAIDEAAASFYRYIGMRQLPDDPNMLHVPVSTLLELMEKS